MVELKVLTPDDWRLWRCLRLFALAESPHAFGSRLAEWTGANDREERWRERLTVVQYNVMAMQGEAAVGMVSAQPNSLDIELTSLYVDPRARGEGVSDILIDAVCQWAYQQKASRIVLSVRESNRAAIRLYVRNYFKAVGPSPESTPEGSEVLFARPL